MWLQLSIFFWMVTRAEKNKTLLKNPQVKGAQIIYAWKLLEPQKISITSNLLSAI